MQKWKKKGAEDTIAVRCQCEYCVRFEYYKPERVRDGYFTYNGLDRIDSSQPHNKNNVVPCCYPCNVAKLDYTQEEFFSQTKKRYEHLVKKGIIRT